jgi:hypothetical protein
MPVTVRSLVRRLDGTYDVEWTATVASWTAARQVVDDVGAARSECRAYTTEHGLARLDIGGRWVTQKALSMELASLARTLAAAANSVAADPQLPAPALMLDIARRIVVIVDKLDVAV